MGIRIQLEDESGNSEGELLIDAFLFRVIPPVSDASYACLRFIDPYGDTIFNRLQIPVFIEELNCLAGTAETKEEKHFLKELLKLAQKCRDEPHFYLRFIGD